MAAMGVNMGSSSWSSALLWIFLKLPFYMLCLNNLLCSQGVEPSSLYVGWVKKFVWVSL